MRVWERYFVTNGNKASDPHLTISDIYDNEHWQAHRQTPYATRSEFFDGYALGSPRRYGFYYEYFKENIKKEELGLSIGSGQCITELRLIDDGYNIRCSDIKDTYNVQTQRLFPEFEFTKLDIMAEFSPVKVDYVISLSMLFLFDRDQLYKIFLNVAASLKTGGRFFVDPSGAEDNAITYFIDKHLCRYDTGLQYAVKKFLLGKKVASAKVFQGYRFKNEEIVAAAQKAGFILEDLKRYDHVTELKDRLLLFNRLPDAVVSCFGRTVPYIRLFKFRKN